MLTQNSLVLEAQVEERPLAKRQEELEEDESPSSGDQGSPTISDADKSAGTTSPVQAKHHRKALLKNDDAELQRIGKVKFLHLFPVLNFCQLLDEVHRRFFTAYDGRQSDTSKRRQSVSGHKRRQTLKVAWDVTVRKAAGMW